MFFPYSPNNLYYIPPGNPNKVSEWGDMQRKVRKSSILIKTKHEICKAKLDFGINPYDIKIPI